MIICVLLSTKVKGYPFEVKINDDSVALADCIKSLDWQVKKLSLKARFQSKN
ncbi:hypothetical protein [uncultured Campylobacter sp.]|uniref:hypothetical protein n=1 Tax=uncultured Campylobacter sp. TaxID=218934 RepID=UPI00345C58D6